MLKSLFGAKKLICLFFLFTRASFVKKILLINLKNHRKVLNENLSLFSFFFFVYKRNNSSAKSKSNINYSTWAIQSSG